MRRIILFTAALAALALAAPAQASITVSSYQVTGDVGSGSFTLEYNDVTTSYILTGLNFNLVGSSTTFDTSNSSLDSSLPVIGGNVNGVDLVNIFGTDDFAFAFDPTAASQTAFLDYFLSGSQGVLFSDLSITREVIRGGVPEPATWAMMLLGFGTIGVAMRRRRSGFQPA
jgi:hypothetical protein